MAELIYKDDHEGLTILRHEAASPEMVDLAAGTIWGSGGTRYLINDIEDKLALLAGSEFTTLELEGRLIGLYVLLAKHVSIGDSTVNAYYGTFLAVDPGQRGRGYGTLLAERTKRYLMPRLGDAGLLYAYVEADNLSSLKALQRAGYQSTAVFRSTILSRWRSCFDPHCRMLEQAERDWMEGLLWELYEDHVLLDFDQSLDPGSYWVMEAEGRLVAGAQVEACEWRILRLPGISGALLVHGVSRMPVLHRLFDARQCRFIKLGNLYVRTGYESWLFTLIESILASQKLNNALIFHDPRSAVFRRIEESGRFGILNSGIDAEVHIMAKTRGFQEQQKRLLRQKPVMISPMDIG